MRAGLVGLCRSLGWISFRWFSGVNNFQGASGVTSFRGLSGVIDLYISWKMWKLYEFS